MFKLDELKPLVKDRKRVGRGGSRGGTSGRGHKGQRSRSGGKTGLGNTFEGGQMPLTRRVPRRGFTSLSRKDFELVNLGDLEAKFDAGENVERTVLIERGLIKGRRGSLVKILGDGEISKKLVVTVDAMSKSAKAAIEAVDGSVSLIGG
ncbi:50S ribosomal protein L15 [Candidatus Babeliales bacterium]|nr:50S ribosomal protein L15 [Candidatus Babeliales bacterium]